MGFRFETVKWQQIEDTQVFIKKVANFFNYQSKKLAKKRLCLAPSIQLPQAFV